MTNFIYKELKFQKLSDFTLNLFVLNMILDPGNGLLHMKQITFFIALLFNLKKIEYNMKYVLMMCVIYVIYFITTALMVFRNIPYDSDFNVTYMTTFLTLIIFFVNPRKICIKKIFILSSIIISLITIAIAIVIIQYPILYLPIEGNETLRAIFILGDDKQFLYWNLVMVFHVSSPLLIITYSLVLYDFYRATGKHQRKLFVELVILFLGLFCTGTRANIFSLLLISLIVFMDYLYFEKKRMLQFVTITIILICLGLIGTYLLLTIKNDSSTVKDRHMESYIEYFDENLSNIIIGTGPGSYFYTKGFSGFTTNTELTYFELIRMFGVFFAFIIVIIYLTPFLLIKKIGRNRNFVLGMSYLSFLFIAGTNPYLIGPTGFLVFWAISVFLYQENNGGIQ